MFCAVYFGDPRWRNIRDCMSPFETLNRFQLLSMFFIRAGSVGVFRVELMEDICVSRRHVFRPASCSYLPIISTPAYDPQWFRAGCRRRPHTCRLHNTRGDSLCRVGGNVGSGRTIRLHSGPLALHVIWNVSPAWWLARTSAASILLASALAGLTVESPEQYVALGCTGGCHRRCDSPDCGCPQARRLDE